MASTSSLPEHLAAAKIQRRFRSWIKNRACERKLIGQVWSILDSRDEGETSQIRQQMGPIKSVYDKISTAAQQPFGDPAPLNTSGGGSDLHNLSSQASPVGIRPITPYSQDSFGERLESRSAEDEQAGCEGGYPVVGDLDEESRTRRRDFSISTKSFHGDLAELTDDDPVTLHFVLHMLDQYRRGRVLSYGNAFQLVKRVYPYFRESPNVVSMKLHPRTKLNVVGDIHGHLDSLFTIFKLTGVPSERNRFLFNGDIVDRGRNSCECLFTILAFKLLYPDAVHVNRGNHESWDQNMDMGFKTECVGKYDEDFFDMCEGLISFLRTDLFAALPLVTLIEKKIFVVHGGLTSEADLTIEKINSIERFLWDPPTQGPMQDLLWSDPQDGEGIIPNDQRMCAIFFGPDVTNEFLALNNLDYIIRSHECIQEGYTERHDGKLITVFSASNYCGRVDNDGAFIILEAGMKRRFIRYRTGDAVDFPEYHSRHGLLREDVHSHLCHLIATNRLNLLKAFQDVDPSGCGSVLLGEWASVLSRELRLVGFPFVKLSNLLGVGTSAGQKNATVGTEMVNYVDFMRKFTPQHDAFDRAFGDPSFASRKSDLSQAFFNHRMESEILFGMVDSNADGTVTTQQFLHACESLKEMNMLDFSDEEISRLMKHIRVDDHGNVLYVEFLAGFRLLDKKAPLPPSKNAPILDSETALSAALAPRGDPSCAAETTQAYLREQSVQENSSALADGLQWGDWREIFDEARQDWVWANEVTSETLPRPPESWAPPGGLTTAAQQAKWTLPTPRGGGGTRDLMTDIPEAEATDEDWDPFSPPPRVGGTLEELWEELVNIRIPTNWFLFGFPEDPNRLEFVEKGDRGIDQLRSAVATAIGSQSQSREESALAGSFFGAFRVVGIDMRGSRVLARRDKFVGFSLLNDFPLSPSSSTTGAHFALDEPEAFSDYPAPPPDLARFLRGQAKGRAALLQLYEKVYDTFIGASLFNQYAQIDDLNHYRLCEQMLSVAGSHKPAFFDFGGGEVIRISDLDGWKESNPKPFAHFQAAKPQHQSDGRDRPEYDPHPMSMEEAFEDLCREQSPTNWILFGFDQKCNSITRSDEAILAGRVRPQSGSLNSQLQYLARGDEGFPELRRYFLPDVVLMGVFRCLAHCQVGGIRLSRVMLVQVDWVGESVQGVDKIRVLSMRSAASQVLGGIALEISFGEHREIDPNLIASELQETYGGERVTSLSFGGGLDIDVSVVNKESSLKSSAVADSALE